jgi:hypothetical protein
LIHSSEGNLYAILSSLFDYGHEFNDCRSTALA